MIIFFLPLPHVWWGYAYISHWLATWRCTIWSDTEASIELLRPRCAQMPWARNHSNHRNWIQTAQFFLKKDNRGYLWEILYILSLVGTSSSQCASRQGTKPCQETGRLRSLRQSCTLKQNAKSLFGSSVSISSQLQIQTLDFRYQNWECQPDHQITSNVRWDWTCWNHSAFCSSRFYKSELGQRFWDECWLTSWFESESTWQLVIMMISSVKWWKLEMMGITKPHRRRVCQTCQAQVSWRSNVKLMVAKQWSSVLQPQSSSSKLKHWTRW